MDTYTLKKLLSVHQRILGRRPRGPESTDITGPPLKTQVVVPKTLREKLINGQITVGEALSEEVITSFTCSKRSTASWNKLLDIISDQIQNKTAYYEQAIEALTRLIDSRGSHLAEPIIQRLCKDNLWPAISDKLSETMVEITGPLPHGSTETEDTPVDDCGEVILELLITTAKQPRLAEAIPLSKDLINNCITIAKKEGTSWEKQRSILNLLVSAAIHQPSTIGTSRNQPIQTTLQQIKDGLPLKHWIYAVAELYKNLPNAPCFTATESRMEIQRIRDQIFLKLYRSQPRQPRTASYQGSVNASVLTACISLRPLIQ